MRLLFCFYFIFYFNEISIPLRKHTWVGSLKPSPSFRKSSFACVVEFFFNLNPTCFGQQQRSVSSCYISSLTRQGGYLEWLFFLPRAKIVQWLTHCNFISFHFFSRKGLEPMVTNKGKRQSSCQRHLEYLQRGYVMQSRRCSSMRDGSWMCWLERTEEKSVRVYLLEYSLEVGKSMKKKHPIQKVFGL